MRLLSIDESTIISPKQRVRTYRPSLSANESLISEEGFATERTHDDVFESEISELYSLKNIIELVKTYDSKPIFDALCYNCGHFLFGRTGQANKQLAICTLTDEDIKINQMFVENPVPEAMYKYQAEGKWKGRFFSCQKCKKGPSLSIKNK